MASLVTGNAPGAAVDEAARDAPRPEVHGGSWPPHGSSGAAPSAPAGSVPVTDGSRGGSAPLRPINALPAEAMRQRFDALLDGEELPDQRPPRSVGSALAAALAGASHVARRAARRRAAAFCARAQNLPWRGTSACATQRCRCTTLSWRRARCGGPKRGVRARAPQLLTRGARPGSHCVQRETSTPPTEAARAPSCGVRPRLSHANLRCSRRVLVARAAALIHAPQRPPRLQLT
jgi:hypothetical protein